MTYREECDALEQGDGNLWEVRVINSADDLDHVDIHVRAPTEEEAAQKAEDHARRYPDMYFDNPPPTYDADLVNIYRVEE